MSENTLVLYGDIAYCPAPDRMEGAENAYLVIVDGKSAGVFRSLPEKYASLPRINYENQLILPGLTDLHVHAPQYAFRGTGMDRELMSWLDTYAFPEEAKYADEAYAREMYGIFAKDLKKSATTRASVFASRHRRATLILMDKLEETGIKTCVGKVNMDRRAPDDLVEKNAETSLEETRRWLEEVSKRHYRNTEPILTPRFVPSCTDELMAGLSELQKTCHLPVQSHLSENQGEIKLVQSLHPAARFYGEVYAHYGLFGNREGTIMAHCVLSSEEEIRLMKKNGVFIAHCPESNTNLSSGIAPVRTYLERGLRVGLGSDIAAGSSLSIFKAMVSAIQVSKLYWRLCDQEKKPLNMTEALYLATKGGGSFFGCVGSFEKGYEADAIIIDDREWQYHLGLSLKERVEKAVYLADDRYFTAKYVSGCPVF